ncbi:NAD(P)/FAD-dependent oxidoreductase [Sphingomonas crocodyli]|uniref:FAD-binding oxidoreductase n=1 Tax=Sphingomonas crocodyli TaxID=1979270 RepID=A0A437M598_9SPHN|nr:FAD-binding oxidoreductase [Sphingomonas crocodyli]RVT92910.1 FAD-binding oxidoreductase [Sphingomonas crocodyli]
MIATQADVLIIGGGLMGSATAFFLRQRGLSVIVLERGLVGQQASGVNFGNVRRQGRFLPQLPLAHRSRALWGRLPELIGEDVEFIVTGHLCLGYRDEDGEALEAYRSAARDYDLDLELLGPNALRERFPYLSREAIIGSMSPDDGHANPRLAAPAFARAAIRAGATVVENCEALTIEKVGEDFVVQTAAGIYRAPILQISAGAWGAQIAERFGELVPLKAFGPQMAVTEPVRYAFKPVLSVTTRDPLEGIYFRQIPRGNVIFGGCLRESADIDTARAQVNPDNTLHQVGQLRRIVPALASLRVIRVWSGVEGYLDDNIPVMGVSSAVPGLYYAFGFCGHGFQLGPGVGDVMAELIATGQTSTPIAPFAISRFARPSPSEETLRVDEAFTEQ